MTIDPGHALWHENLATHVAKQYRQMLSALTGRHTGIVMGADLEVVQRGAGANMSVDVGFGSAVILHTDGSSNENGSYFVHNDGTVNVVIAASDVTNDRHDLVVIDVRDSEVSGINNDARLRIVQGTPAASPSDPATPDNAIVLARVLVNNGATSILTADITNLRPQLGYAHTELEQVSVTGGPTSAGTELTLATLNIAARTARYQLDCSAFWTGENTVDADTFDFRIKVAGTERAKVGKREGGGANVQIPFSIPSTQLVDVAANTAVAVTVTIQRRSGTGTINTDTAGRLTARLYS